MPTQVDQNHGAVAPFLDGVASESSSERTLAVTNPSHGQRILSIPEGCSADVDRAVSSGRRAFEDGRWSETAPAVRKKVLHRFADLIAAESAALDALDAGEMGKPVREQWASAGSAANLMRFNAESLDKVLGDVYVTGKQSFATQRYVPRGVVAAVVPWNFPTYNAVLKIAPALAAGNSVVLKPSELASRSALRLAHLAMQAGLPPGVLNVVLGLGETVGRALGLHRDVDMIAFTGSVEVGKCMLEYAGQSNFKVVLAECGGKSPHVVFNDTFDLDATADSIARMLLTNQGQICSVGSRLVVQRSIEAQMVEKIAARFRQVVMGDALDPQTTFGPVASAKQCERIMRYIDIANADGAQLMSGGRRALQNSGGFFVEPALLRDVNPTARVAQEEIFGPVLSVIPFDSESEAVQIANNTVYGLAAYVWTSNLSTGMRVAKAIRSAVWINAAAPVADGSSHAVSYEPARESGVGTEGGLVGMTSYLRRQPIWINHG